LWIADSVSQLLFEFVNKMQPCAVKRLQNMIEDNLCKSYYYLWKDAFQIVNNGIRSPTNMNIFESIMFNLFDQFDMALNRMLGI